MSIELKKNSGQSRRVYAMLCALKASLLAHRMFTANYVIDWQTPCMSQCYTRIDKSFFSEVQCLKRPEEEVRVDDSSNVS